MGKAAGKSKERYRQELTSLIRNVLLLWSPLTRLTTEDLREHFHLSDLEANKLVGRLRYNHILRYFDRTKKTVGGLVVTDYAQDVLDKRVKWEREHGVK